MLGVEQMTIPSWCRVGQRVVCITAFKNSLPVSGVASLPVVGATYTIREAREWPTGCDILLVEMKNPPVDTRYGIVERGFLVERFRPLVDDKSDNEIECRLYHKHKRDQSVKSPRKTGVSA